MSCRRARRELLWLVRFGDFDQGSAPHLDHLAACRSCREDVGMNRALVRQLRTALAARIDNAAPSPTAWDGILARMRQPEPRPSGLRSWVTRLAAGLRAGTAMAGAGLALVLALNLDVVPLAPAPSPDIGAESASRPTWAGDLPPFVVVAPPPAPPQAEPVAEAPPRVGARPLTEAEQLPPGRAEAASSAKVEPPEEPPGEPAVDAGWQGLVVRLVPSDAARFTGAAGDASGVAAIEREIMPAPPIQGPS